MTTATMTMTAPPKAKITQADKIAGAKAKARTLRGRLLAGLDRIFEAQGDDMKAASLQAHYDRLEAEYIDLKKVWAKTPEDLDRCPDCPNLGRGILRVLNDCAIICDCDCPKEGQA